MTTPGVSAQPAAEERLLRERLQCAGYLADEDLATTVWLASALQRPLLLEGDAGVGKTALATALAQSQGATLVRLQCFEGLDLAQAAYEWNYGRQLMAIRMSEAAQNSGSQDGAGRVRESDVFSRDYLLERPLLRAMELRAGPVAMLQFLSAFRYPLAGESALESSLLSRLNFSSTWGLEIGLLEEVRRQLPPSAVCQTELCAAYDHKHHELSPDDPEHGLHRIAAHGQHIAPGVRSRLMGGGDGGGGENLSRTHGTLTCCASKPDAIVRA